MAVGRVSQRRVVSASSHGVVVNRLRLTLLLLVVVLHFTLLLLLLRHHLLMLLLLLPPQILLLLLREVSERVIRRRHLALPVRHSSLLGGGEMAKNEKGATAQTAQTGGLKRGNRRDSLGRVFLVPIPAVSPSPP